MTRYQRHKWSAGRGPWAWLCAALMVWATAAWAEAPDAGPSSSARDPDEVQQVLDLVAALRIEDIAQVLQAEGMDYGGDLDRDMLDGRGGAYWADHVEDTYSAARLTDTITMALLNDLGTDEIADSMAFLQSEAGQAIISLETSARAALQDADVEAAARSRYDRLKERGDARLDAIAQYVDANDLLEQNVSGALGFTYYLYRGMVDGGALEMDDDTILAQVMIDEPDIRVETESWLYGFLLMAYHPLSDADLQANLAFSQSDAGQALNAALFRGFEAAYRDISYGLGLGLAAAMGARDL